MAGPGGTLPSVPPRGASIFATYLVATNNDAERVYFAGHFRCGDKGWDSFEPVLVAEPERAKALASLHVAQRIACGLTELAAALPPHDARTFYAFERPETVSQVAARIRDAVRK